MIAGLTALSVRVHPPRATPEDVAAVLATGTSIIVRNADRATLWTHDFGGRFGENDGPNAPRRIRWASADLDRDGRMELLVAGRLPSTNGKSWTESIYCFSNTGVLQWSYTPDFTMSFGGVAYEGPWRNYEIHSSMASGRWRVWASYGHETWWPSFVVELDARGSSALRYVQSGAVYALADWSPLGHQYLVAGGVENDYERASVAVLDLNGPPAASIERAGSYACDACPSGKPAFFALLPRTEVNHRSERPYNWVIGIRTNGRRVEIDSDEYNGAYAMYFVDEHLAIREAAFQDNYWQVHGLMEDGGLLTHPAAQCPDRRRPQTIETWKPDAGWSQVSMTFR